MTTRTLALLLSLATPALAATVGCTATDLSRGIGFSNSAVPVEGVTYRVVNPAPSTMQVVNLGDHSVAVSVRERPEGPVVMSFQLPPGAKRSASMKWPRFFVALSASPRGTSVSLTLTISRESDELAKERPTLTLYRAGED